MRFYLFLTVVLVVTGTRLAWAQRPAAESLRLWLDELDRAAPRQPLAFSAATTDRLARAAPAIEAWAAQVAEFRGGQTDAQFFEAVRELLTAKSRVDRILNTTLDVRRSFAALPENPARHEAICRFLKTISGLIDLTGRLRYLQVDALNAAAPRLVARPALRNRLLDLLLAERSSVGAFVAAQFCLAPPEGAPTPNIDQTTINKVLRLIEAAGDQTLLPLLAQAIGSGKLPAGQVIGLGETVRAIGLPQEPWPDPIEPLPPPPFTPKTLLEALNRLPKRLPADLARRRAGLTGWLERLAREGWTEQRYRLGTIDVRPGDWLLMRNPSPYNQFTDLTPGLFTHVGVVTLAKGRDGLSHMVLVDLPERGSRVPAANLETYVLRSLNWCFLRHPEPAVAHGMAQAAHDVIGNEALFDLNFRLGRVLELKGQSLVGKKVETYCAGLLLLCALQTTAPREDFFPVREHPAGGQTLDNLAKLGLSMDDDFISPTGAMFSTRLELVGRREPMYDPRREVEEVVFDHFAHQMAAATLVPSPDWFQSLRLKLAEASQTNDLLAEALATAARVNASTDLVSAAKAAAVVETLDEIAFGASREFLAARDALRDDPAEVLARDGVAPEEVAEVGRYQRRHAQLYQARKEGRLSPRQLRLALVKYYCQSGTRELDRRFFTPPPDAKP